MAETEGDVENRFAHLLQPIRDLAENWNIDIASELEEYLAELETVSFSFEDGGKAINFAEAALLIQGSTCIYSKKVEYLYQLLYQTLDFVQEKRKQKPAQSSLVNGVDKDIETIEEPEFLCLDDIEEAEGIDLVEQNETTTPSRISTSNRTALSLAVSLHKASSQDEQSGGDRRTDFRINTCSLDPSGALLLEEKETDTDHAMQDLKSSNRPSIQIESPSGEIEPQRIIFEGPEMDSDDDSNEPIVMDTRPDNEKHEKKSDIRRDAEDEQTETRSYQESQKAKEKNSPKRRNLPSKKIRKNFEWELLDPHDEEPHGQTIRPFQKGKTYQLPKKQVGEGETEKKNEPVSRVPRLSQTVFPEFEYILKKVAKIHLLNRRRRRAELEEVQTERKSAVSVQEEEEQVTSYFAGHNFDDDSDDEGPEPLENPLPMIELQPSMQNEGPSYDELCRSHIEAYLLKSSECVQESELTQRISEWQRRLDPILEEQKTYPTFDIHKYGSDLISRFPSIGTTLDYSEVISSTKPYNIRRNFAAILQLANSRNIEMIPGVGINSFSVKLLNQHIKNDFTEYRPPSQAIKSKRNSKSKHSNPEDQENIRNFNEVPVS